MVVAPCMGRRECPNTTQKCPVPGGTFVDRVVVVDGHTNSAKQEIRNVTREVGTWRAADL
eukprot:m.121981 g.121981  ORF g.121981 m.121981 type:complete len:60 (+) comp21931_c0_seq1:333-512(+)